MGKLIILFGLMLQSLAWAAPLYVGDTGSSEYNKYFVPLSDKTKEYKKSGEECNPGLENPCEVGYECSAVENNEANKKLYPKLYTKTKCLFRLDCKGSDKSPKMICYEAKFATCKAGCNGGASCIENCKTSSSAACATKDEKCNYADSCLSSTAPDEEAEEGQAAYCGYSENFGKAQNQECDSNWCEKMDPKEDGMTGDAICMQHHVCMPEETLEEEFESPAVVVPSRIDYEVQGVACQPQMYEVDEKGNRSPVGVVSEKASNFERFINGVEYLTNGSTQVEDVFGINQKLRELGRFYNKERIKIQQLDNDQLAKIEEEIAKLQSATETMSVSSGSAFINLLMQQHQEMAKIDTAKMGLFVGLDEQAKEVVKHNADAPYKKFGTHKRWFSITWYGIKLHYSFCGKTIFYNNRWCVKSCWDLPDRKLVDPLIPDNLGKEKSSSIKYDKYDSVMSYLLYGLKKGDFLESGDVAVSAIPAGITKSLAGGTWDFGNIAGKYKGAHGLFHGALSKPKPIKTTYFKTQEGLARLQKTMIKNFADYAMLPLSSSSSSSQINMPLMVSDYDMKLYFLDELINKGQANPKSYQQLSSSEKARIEKAIQELKKNNRYLQLRQALAFAQTGKKAFEFFRWYGSQDACKYWKETKGKALDGLQKRVAYLRMYYEASSKLHQDMANCLSGLADKFDEKYDVGTGVVGKAGDGGVAIPGVVRKDMKAIAGARPAIDNNSNSKIVSKLRQVNFGTWESGSFSSGSFESGSMNSGAYSSGSLSSGSINSGSVGAGKFGGTKSVISSTLEELNAKAKKNQEKYAKTKEGKSFLARAKSAEDAFSNSNFNDGAKSNYGGSSLGNLDSAASLGAASGASAGAEAQKKASSSSKGGSEEGASASAVSGTYEIEGLQNLKMGMGMGAGANLSGKGGNSSDKEYSSEGAGNSPEKLTGLNAQETSRIKDGLSREGSKYKSVVGTEDDDLFKIVTKTYFRAAYPVIFSKDSKK